MSSDTAPIGHNRFPGIHPEKLLKIEIEEISDLLELEFRALAQRSAELLAKVQQWPRRNGAMAINDDHDLAKLTDLYVQVRDHAADRGEVDATRVKIKAGPLAAGHTIDAYFNNLRTDLLAWLFSATEVQKSYIRERDDRERRRLQAIAVEEAAAAAAALQAARAKPTEENIERATIAEGRAEEAATAPQSQRTKITSTLGKTTSAGSVWKAEVTDIKKLASAVLAGKVPANCLTYDPTAIRAAVNGKPPLRNKAGEDIGIRIYEDIQLRRRG